MSFIGKSYKFVSEENFQEFVTALGMAPEHAANFINYRPTITFTKNGDEYVYSTETAQGKKDLSFKSGVPYSRKVADRDCTTTITVDGNKVTQVEEFDDGASVTYSREFNGDDLVLTLTTSKWDGSARRYYKA